MRQLPSELRDAFRSLKQRPAFTAAVVLTLALAIGATTAIFSAVDALLVRSLPFPDADRLVRIQSVRGGQSGSVSYREVQDLRELRDVFEDVAAYTDQGRYNASGFGRPEELTSTITTGNLFSVLGVPLLVGERWPELLDRTRDFKIVISYGLWQRRFGGAPDVVGRTMTLDGAEGYTVVGVAQRDFAFPLRADLYRSHGIAAGAIAYEDRARRGRWGVARLRDGVTLERANARMATLAKRLEAEFPSSNTGIGYLASPLRTMYVGEARPFLALLFGAVALVLAIACCNVANLLLSRGLAREREVAVRVALGASRADIVRTLLAESAVLGLVSGVLGIAIAVAGVQLITSLMRMDMPIWITIGLSWRVFVFTAVVSIAAGILAGLLPAVRAVDGDVAGALKEGGRTGTAGPRRHHLRSALVVSEMVLAVVLLVGAGLLVRSFQAITQVQPGFEPDSVVTFRVELGWRAYPDLAASSRFQRELQSRLAELPGVTAVGMVDNLPLGGRPTIDDAVMLEGQDAGAQRANPFLNRRTVSPGFFDVLRVPLRAGRVFTADDRDSMPKVVVVSDATARRLWPGRDAVGQRLRLNSSDFRLVNPGDSLRLQWLTVVGVVGDVRHEGLTSPPALDVYVPFEQWNNGSIYFLLRTARAADTQLLARRAPELVLSIDPHQSYFDVRSMRDRVSDRTWVPRLTGALFAAFGVLAMGLAVIGIYAVLAFQVAQRRHEFSIRQALGATTGSVAALVLRAGARLTAMGAIVGVAMSLGLGRVFSRLLFEVGPADPTTYGFVLGLLAVVSLSACLVPAWRATRINVVDAMRAAEGGRP